jgi:hypothetical protein
MSLSFQEVRQMRCLYCGIRLKIAEKAKVIEHCPECSKRLEHEDRRDPVLRLEDRSTEASNGRRLHAYDFIKSV